MMAEHRRSVTKPLAEMNNSIHHPTKKKCLDRIICEDSNHHSPHRLVKIRAFVYAFNRSNRYAHMIVSDDIQRKYASMIFFEFVMSNINSDKMKKLVNNLGNIDVEHIVKITIDGILTNMASKSPLPGGGGHIHYAPTQSGKSAVKDLIIYVCLSLNVSVILMTKGVGESKELTSKIASYLPAGSSGSGRFFSPYMKNLNDIETAFIKMPERACVLVIPDTEKQIEYARWLQIERLQYAGKNEYLLRHVWIFDEGDALTNRSVLETQKNEVEITKAMELLKPYVVNVTATPVPLFRKARDRREMPIITTLIKKTDNYVGVENFRYFKLDPFSLNKGFPFPKFKPKYKVNDSKKTKSLALFQVDKVMPRNKFPDIVNRKNPKIPKLDEYSMLIIKKELRKGKGQLTLINTCSRVNKGENIFDQAATVQDYLYTKLNKETTAIVIHADNVFYRFPGHKYGLQCKTALSSLIDAIDKHPDYGLKMPVLIFGYYSMRRSKSLRSSQRVPTSMIMCTGKGQSNENICQIAGRLTGKGMNVLKRNRKTDQVLLVCPPADYTIIVKHNALVTEIIDLYHQGILQQRQRSLNYAAIKLFWDEIFAKASSSKNNYLLESKRKTGNIATPQNKNAFTILSGTESVGVARIDPTANRRSDLKEELLDHKSLHQIEVIDNNKSSSSTSLNDNDDSSFTSSTVVVVNAANTKNPKSFVARSKTIMANKKQLLKTSANLSLMATRRSPSPAECSILPPSRKRKSPWRRKEQKAVGRTDNDDTKEVIDLSDDNVPQNDVIDLSADNDDNDDGPGSKTN